MPRRRTIIKRETQPDSIYNDILVAKFVNIVMRRGKKSVAEKIVYNTLNLIRKKSKEDPLMILKKSIENVKPALEIKSRRVGGATYQVPVEIREDRRLSLAIRWIVSYARARNEKGMVQKLSSEIIDAFNNRGGAIKKREDTHKMAEANKVFVHYRW